MRTPDSKSEFRADPEVDAALIEILLQSAYDHDKNDEIAKFDRLMGQIEDESKVTSEAKSQNRSPASRFWRRMIPLALAASMLLIVGYGLIQGFGLSQAQAAVARCLEVMPPIREYQVDILANRPLKGEHQVTVNLFLDDKDRFALRHPGLLGLGSVWIGGDSQQRWVVPAAGPILLGGEALVGRWLAKQSIDSPYLHVDTMLTRMSQAYKLRMLENEVLPSASNSAGNIECQHIIGHIRSSRDKLPETIELWANVETGMAEKVVMAWNRKEYDLGPISWTIQYMGAPQVSSDWFDYQGHCDQGRATRNVRKIDDLDEAGSDSA